MSRRSTTMTQSRLGRVYPRGTTTVSIPMTVPPVRVNAPPSSMAVVVTGHIIPDTISVNMTQWRSIGAWSPTLEQQTLTLVTNTVDQAQSLLAPGILNRIIATRRRAIAPLDNQNTNAVPEVRLDIPQTNENIRIRPEAQDRCQAYMRRQWGRAVAWAAAPEGRCVRWAVGGLVTIAITVTSSLIGVGILHMATVPVPDALSSFTASELMEKYKTALADEGFEMPAQLVPNNFMPIVKEVMDWIQMTEKEFWNNCRPTKEISGDPASNANIAFQIAAIEMMSMMAEGNATFNPPWSWILPTDGPKLVLELALIYKNKGPDALYNHIRDFRYGEHKVILPRTVACDVVTTALTGLYEPLADETKAQAAPVGL